MTGKRPVLDIILNLAGAEIMPGLLTDAQLASLATRPEVSDGV